MSWGSSGWPDRNEAPQPEETTAAGATVPSIDAPATSPTPPPAPPSAPPTAMPTPPPAPPTAPPTAMPAPPTAMPAPPTQWPGQSATPVGQFTPVTPVGQFTPAAPPPTPSGGGRSRVLMVLLIALLMLGGIAGGVAAALALTGDDDGATSATNDDATKGGQDGTGKGTDDASDPTTQASEDTTPVVTPTKKACWNGAVIQDGQACSTAYDATTLFWAFSVDRAASNCSESATGGEAWNDISITCTIAGARIHFARYSSPDARAGRQQAYGACASLGGNRVECGTGNASRHLLTYDTPDVLFYASSGGGSAAYGALKKVRDTGMRTREELLFGVPVE